MSEYLTETQRWSAVQSRDPLADGSFVYCVKTTGIYCRPVCKARLARRANVEFMPTPAEAEAAGYRPCMRCKPELDSQAMPDEQRIAVNEACELIEMGERDGTKLVLESLAKEVGFTKSHFHRVFKKVTGVTPRAYAELIRQRPAGPGPTQNMPDMAPAWQPDGFPTPDTAGPVTPVSFGEPSPANAADDSQHKAIASSDWEGLIDWDRAWSTF